MQTDTQEKPVMIRLFRIPALYDVSLATIYRAIQRGELLPAHRGRAARIRVSDLEAWLDDRAAA